jgi:hypothetical protein
MARNVPCNPYMKTILFVFVTITINQVASAQLVSFGVKGGVPFLAPNQGGDESRPYIVGPSVEFRLPAGFAIELDALYRRIGSTSAFGFSTNTIFVPPLTPPYITSFVNRQRGNYWEFPVLGKYYFRPRSTAWQPFIGTGWALRTVSFHNDISETVVSADGTSHSDSFRNHFRSDVGVGATFAAGVRFRVGRVAVIPELRYTYWGRAIQNSLRNNEAAGLLGVSF